jgi:hypothetical protein
MAIIRFWCIRDWNKKRLDDMEVIEELGYGGLNKFWCEFGQFWGYFGGCCGKRIVFLLGCCNLIYLPKTSIWLTNVLDVHYYSTKIPKYMHILA